MCDVSPVKIIVEIPTQTLKRMKRDFKRLHFLLFRDRALKHPNVRTFCLKMILEYITPKRKKNVGKMYLGGICSYFSFFLSLILCTEYCLTVIRPIRKGGNRKIVSWLFSQVGGGGGRLFPSEI